MLARSNCRCLVCAIELDLRLALAETTIEEGYQRFISQRQLLSGFPTAMELIAHLHHHEQKDRDPSPDKVFLELIDWQRTPVEARMWQPLLLLVFIPTIHRTTSQVVAIFPGLARDDIAQHLIAAFLEFWSSQELKNRRSHFPFAVARRLRRCAFRWAIRESRLTVTAETSEQHPANSKSHLSKAGFQAPVLLNQFLDDCQRRGWLTTSERRLIVESKIEGTSCRELALRNGHSAIAVQHRIHRLVAKLRRLAQTSERREIQQMNLFQK